MTDGIRTRDIQGHNLTLCQLSYGHQQEGCSECSRRGAEIKRYLRSRCANNCPRGATDNAVFQTEMTDTHDSTHKSAANGFSLYLWAIGLAIVTLWLFWPATGYEFLNFDDDRYVSGNHMVLQGLSWAGIQWALRTVYESYWLPVIWLSYMVDSTVFGTAPFGYHFTNVLLHALNAGLLFLLLNRWTKQVWASLFVAALFAWHPLRVESVAWISERKDVLSGFFFLLCLMAYTKFSRNPGTGREVPAALFMALGLLTKPILVTLPFLLLLLDYWPLNRWRLNWGSIKTSAWSLIGEKVLFWALMALFCIMTYYTQKTGLAVHDTSMFPWSQRLNHIPAAFLFYIEKTLFPFQLSMVYGDLVVSPRRFLVSVVVLVGITGAVLWGGRRCKAIPVGWLWFLGLLIPVIGFVRVGVTHVADRFTYLPSIGLGICVTWGVACLLPPRRWIRATTWCLALAILAGCVWQTRRVLPRWATSFSAFENVLHYFPNNVLANNNYGEALLSSGQIEEALHYFDKAAALEPRTAPFISNSALALLSLHRTDEAIGRLSRAMREIDPNNPFLQFVLGLAWIEKGQLDRAIPLLVKANETHATPPVWRIELARALVEVGKTAEASNEFAQLARDGFPQLTGFDGLCTYYASLWEKGHSRRAWTFFKYAIETYPDSIGLLNNVAWFLAVNPPPDVSPDEAIRLALHAKELCTVVPPNVLDTLAAAYAKKGDFDQALHWAEESLAMAQSKGLTNLAKRIEARRAAYQKGIVWMPDGVPRAAP